MATTAERERVGTGKGQQRAAAAYRRPRATISFGQERFTFIAHRGDKGALALDPMVQQVSWDDNEAVLRGSLTLTIPKGRRIDLGIGHRIECRVRRVTGGRYRRLWMMRVTGPDSDVGAGQVTLTLESDLALIARSRGDFKYRKGKNRHKRGWRADQVARDVCRKQRIRVTRLARGSHYISKLNHLDASPLDVIRAAYDKEAKATGRRFIISYSTAGLRVDTFRPSADMLSLGKTLLSARISRSIKEEGFATAVTVQGTIGEGKSKHKVSETVENTRAVKRYGYVHRILKLDNLKSEADARRKGRRHLARVAQPKREVTISHPGLPWLKRFDVLRVHLPEEGFAEICWVKTVQHSLSAGSYVTTITVQFSDPFYDARAARVARKRQQASAKRRRAEGKTSRARRDPKPRKGEQRS